jgi:putative aldouronate transport system substrate-binding protein
MNRKRIVFALVLALALAAGTVFADGAPEQVTPRTITFVANNLIGEAMGLDAIIERFYELTGVELKVIIPPHQQYKEKLQVMAASGDLPDVWQVWTPLDLTFAREGVNIPLDDYIAESKNIRRIDKHHFLPFTVDGKIYGIPFNGGGGTVTYVRQDWLDNLGMEAPTTLNEFIEVAKAFNFEDPDRNGKDDTVGYSSIASGVSPYYWPTMLQGAVPDFVLKDGKWIDGFTQPDMKEAIERIRKGYNDGWIDPEIFTNSTGVCRDKFTHGVTGYFSYWSGAWGPVLQQRTEASCGEKTNVVALDPIGKTNYWNRPSVPQCITVKAEDPKFVFDTLLDRMWDQGEMEFLFIHGVEGVHWEVKNGKYVKLPRLDNPELLFTKTYIHPELTLLPLKNEPFEFDPRLFASEAARQKNIKQFYIPSGGDVYAKNVGDLGALRSEVFAKIIAGDMTLEEGYKYYNEMAKELQIDEMIKELEETG